MEALRDRVAEQIDILLDGYWAGERGAVIGMAFDAIMMVHGWAHRRSKPEDFDLKIEKICDHIDHICQLAGNAQHVGLGTDLDGGFGTLMAKLGGFAVTVARGLFGFGCGGYGAGIVEEL